MRSYIAFLLILLASPLSQAADGSAPTFKLSGDIHLLSHYVENGLSQTDNSPSLQASFWFNFGPQFRLGLWGSNTNYEDSNDHFNLRLNADLRVDLTANSRLRIAYSDSKYYNAGDRNGNILGIHLDFFDNYHVSYESFSNFEAARRRSTRYGLGHTMTFASDWKWKNEIGYNKVDSVLYNPYFDARTAVGMTAAKIYLEGAVTATSESSQFTHGEGNVFFILSASTEF